MNSNLYLSAPEIKHITSYTQQAKQREALESMGYTVVVRPDGTFWVPRAQFEEHGKPERKKKQTLNFGALKNNGKAA